MNPKDAILLNSNQDIIIIALRDKLENPMPPFISMHYPQRWKIIGKYPFQRLPWVETG
ncbi:MAG: hypothetical protein PWQ37_2414 [Candidatus Petromonas sp.]|jgi:hypothetical protein|nr:hypothetical protein [Candidatus Petromonas sp.]